MECRVLSGKDCVVTSPFGMRVNPVSGIYKLHAGVDVVGSGYTLAYITAHTGGRVEKSQYNSSLGYYVDIRLSNGDKMRYCHMTSALQVSAGDTVEHGQILGFMGSTGNSTGAHLHFGIMHNGEWIDPEPYLREDYLTMTYEQFCEYMARYESERNEKPVSDWAKDSWTKAQENGTFDGTRPKAPLTRQEYAIIHERLKGE